MFSPISPSAQYEGVTPSSGSNFTLSIRDFSGLNDGGVYRCKLQVKGYAELLQSSPIRVNGELVCFSAIYFVVGEPHQGED